MVRRAVASIARNGPASEQDRWEENPGISAFTIAIAIAALVAAAPWLDEAARDYALDLADDWNERMEEWCYVVGTPMADQAGVAGYYVRIAPPHKDGGVTGRIVLRNRHGETIEASCLVAMDFSWLVRLGLRKATDPRVADTIKVVDRVLRVETPSGAVYRRYNDDGYGEYDDGRPYDGAGVGRAWPLLAGERGHLALQAGEDPIAYLDTIHRCASPGGLLPEQVWDAAPIPERFLFPGRPSGSAMPLLWSHAEFLKLLDCPPQRAPGRASRSRCASATAAGRRRRRTRAGATRRRSPVWRRDGRCWSRTAAPSPCISASTAGSDVADLQAAPLPFGLWGVALAPDAHRRPLVS